MNEREKENLMYIKDLEKTKDKIERKKNELVECIEAFIKNPNEIILDSILDSMLSQDNIIALKSYGEIYKLYQILTIIKQEYNEGRNDKFCVGVYNIQDLIDKYTLTVFALRRIEMNFSKPDIMEGIHFIVESKISTTAMVYILNNELFNKPKEVLTYIYECLNEG